MKFSFTLLIFIHVFFSGASSQTIKNKIVFGDVTAKDFEPAIYKIDSSAAAVILFDGGSAKYGQGETWFNVIYTYHKRIRLLNSNAFDEATVQIPLYKSERDEDKLNKMEAVTYNVEKGIVIKTKVEKESVFRDKSTKDITLTKFTFPNLKAGCIIEYTYTITSPRTNYLRGWTFQDRYPVLQSNYEITVPAIFDFVYLNSGQYNLSPEVNEGSASYRLISNTSPFRNSEVISFNLTVLNSKWQLFDLPAIVTERFTTNIKNHVAKIEFQLHSLNFPESPPEIIMGTWEQLANTLKKEEHFGAGLVQKNIWLEADLKNLIIQGQKLESAKNIYRFVQRNFTCTDYDALEMNENIKKVYEAKKGNVAEVNLVLTAMLKKAEIQAEPVLLSTRNNGFAYEEYPLINKFNYVISRAVIDNKEYLLDASRKKTGFNHLPAYCYNGSGRIISDTPYLVSLRADSLKERKLTTIFISTGENEKRLTVNYNSLLGYNESYDLRESIGSTGTAEYFKKIKGQMGVDALKNPAIDSLDNYDERAAVSYNFTMDFKDDLIYFNPLLGEAYKSNPFSAAVRNYPVEMPYTTNETVIVDMDIPKGYRIDELPKSERITFNESEGMFEYIITATSESVQLRSKIVLNKANFPPEEYQTLRDFYANVVKKQSEQIVFKKIN